MIHGRVLLPGDACSLSATPMAEDGKWGKVGKWGIHSQGQVQGPGVQNPRFISVDHAPFYTPSSRIGGSSELRG